MGAKSSMFALSTPRPGSALHPPAFGEFVESSAEVHYNALYRAEGGAIITGSPSSNSHRSSSGRASAQIPNAAAFISVSIRAANALIHPPEGGSW